MNGHTCPECGTDRGAASDGGRPGCGCAERAAEAIRTARSAELAAAEDFHPLRIRPYVTLPIPAADGDDHGDDDDDDGRGDAAVTMPLAVVPAGMSVAPAAGPDGDGPDADGPGHDGGHDTGQEPPVRAPLPAFTPVSPPEPVPDGPPRRRGRGLWIAVGAAAVAVVGTAAFAGGLFSGDEGNERALPDTVSEASPSASESTAAASASQSASVSPSPSASASASASPSASVSPSASASPTATASATASASSAKPVTPSASAKPSTEQADGTPEASPESGPVTLSRGDRGPEVEELQERLRQLWLYNGPANGQFNDPVEQGVSVYQSYMSIEGDPEGVYGPNTRRALEADTQEP